MQLCGAFLFALLSSPFVIHIAASFDYGAALTKSLLYYEGQRSGKLPGNQRVEWRGDSGLNDGQDNEVDLVGGYYDAGDGLKLGFPMAFTITMLSWSTFEFRDKLNATNELSNALEAIKWGTDYLMKAHTHPDVLYGQVGVPDSDHACWQRPEDMTTPRTSFFIDDDNFGSDLAAETAAALAAASMAFDVANYTHMSYSSQLLRHATTLFEYANNHPGLYSERIPYAKEVYASSGYKDEMLWAAAWLYIATQDQQYLDYLGATEDAGGVRSSFSWDDKYVGAQILVAKLILDGDLNPETSGPWDIYKSAAEEFICSCIQKGNNNVNTTPGGLLWFLPWNNVQYVATASFSAAVYSQYLNPSGSDIDEPLQCNGGSVNASDLTAFVKSQVDYMLGSNPKGMSYMVGYGLNYPQKIHHRGASIVSIKEDPTPVTCQGGFDEWFKRNSPNPNVLVGAVVSPDENDNFNDSRSDYQHSEPTTVTNAPLVGVLAYLA